MDWIDLAQQVELLCFKDSVRIPDGDYDGDDDCVDRDKQKYIAILFLKESCV